VERCGSDHLLGSSRPILILSFGLGCGAGSQEDSVDALPPGVDEDEEGDELVASVAIPGDANGDGLVDFWVGATRSFR